MKKTLMLLLAALLCLALCACGGKTENPAPTPEAAPQVTETPAAETAAPTETPADAPAEPSAFEKAEACVGKDVEELYAAIGQPVSAEDYAPSCLGDGEDGILHYEGFSVYTYREGELERVDTVLAD